MRQEIDRYVNYALIILLIYLAFLIAKPYILVIFTSIITAFIAYPLYTALLNKLKNKTIAAGIATATLFLIIIIPLLLIGNIIRVEAINIYQSFNLATIKESLTSQLNLTLGENAEAIVTSIASSVASYLFSTVSSFVLSIPQKIISIFIMTFTIFYTFKEGKQATDKFLFALPIGEQYRHRIQKRFTETLHSLLYGEILISGIEWIIATIGFYLIGIPNPAIFGLLVGLVALLPSIGPTFIWVPLAIYAYLTGNATQAILLASFGFIVLSLLLDTIVRTKVLGLKGHIHPLIILIGVIGGISTFGLIGLLLGPVILVILDLLFDIYIETKHGH